MRRMSCSMTIDAVRDRSKTVTRRRVETWSDLEVGDRLTLVEKAQGLKPGERQVVLAVVEIVAVFVVPLAQVLIEPDATAKEGLPELTGREFCERWLKGHGYKPAASIESTWCRRIEWKYVEEGETDV